MEEYGMEKDININRNVEYEIKYGKGHIKEYNYNVNLIYEGEDLNGERNGKGKEYYTNMVTI